MGQMTRPRANDSIRPVTVDTFGGFSRRPQTKDGTIRYEKNVWSGAYPALETRPARKKVSLTSSAHDGMEAVFTREGDVYSLKKTVSSGTATVTLYKADVSAASGITQVAFWTSTDVSSARSVANIANYICVFPDMKVIDVSDASSVVTADANAALTSDNFTVLENEYVGDDDIQIHLGVLKLTGSYTESTFLFRQGDAVEITGNGYKRTAIIRKLYFDAGEVLFGFDDETLWEWDENNKTVEKLERNPEFEPISTVCEVNGRIWGYRGNFMYASALNNPFNWMRFDGISTDSWNVEAPGGGEITGVAAFNGAPYFFKENGIIKIYGSAPDEYVAQMTEGVGVRAGNERSIVSVGGALYYNSRAGVMRYAGSVPTPISFAFGDKIYRYAVGGTDGLRYYVNMRDYADVTPSIVSAKTFVYDPSLGEWFGDDESKYIAMYGDGTLWALDEQGDLYILGVSSANVSASRLTKETDIETSIIFNDIEGTYGTAYSRSYYGRKALSRADLRLTLYPGTKAKVWIRYDKIPTESDADADWSQIASAECAVTGGDKKSVRIPIVPRRCDHFALRITTTTSPGNTGRWILHSLTLFKHQGTDIN